MNASLEDYWKAVDGLVEDVRRMDRDASSVLLYGSMARGTVTPGISDIMDALVFLQAGVLENEERFDQCLEIMVEACKHLSERGLPFHPFNYWFLDETHLLEAMFLATNTSARSSKVVFGDDLSSQFGGNPASYFAARTAFFDMRRQFHQMSIYLHEGELSAAEREMAIYVLRMASKYAPLLACIALNIWPDVVGAVAALQEALPELDTDLFLKLRTVQEHPDTMTDSDELKDIITRLMIFLEELNDRLLSYLRTNDEWWSLYDALSRDDHPA